MGRAFLLGCSLLAACGSDTAPPTKTVPPSPEVTMERQLTPRDRIPTAIQPLLPQRGIYAAGGGLMSAAWRVVVDRDAKTIYGGTAGAANAPSFGPMDRETTRPLSPRNETHLVELAEAAWREPRPRTPPDPTADYDEILIIVDRDEAFFLQGFGPIRRPAAAQAIVELRAAAGL